MDVYYFFLVQWSLLPDVLSGLSSDVWLQYKSLQWGDYWKYGNVNITHKVWYSWQTPNLALLYLNSDLLNKILLKWYISNFTFCDFKLFQLVFILNWWRGSFINLFHIFSGHPPFVWLNEIMQDAEQVSRMVNQNALIVGMCDTRGFQLASVFDHSVRYH